MYSIQEQPEKKHLNIFLFDDLSESNKYYPLIGRLAELTTKHSVCLYIDSTGGDFHTSIVLSNAIRLCKAQVNGVIMCRCYSGATAVALACDKIIVQPHASFMIHNCRIWRKVDGLYINELSDWVETELQIWHSFFKTVYLDSGFLTMKESNDILKGGRELYITSVDLKRRLKKMNLLCTKSCK